MCLIIEDIIQNELDEKVNPKWNQIEVKDIYVSHQAFIFQQHSFYFRMLHKTVNNLIDTGVVKYLLDNHLKRKKIVKLEDHARVLRLKDLLHGFNIWLGFCGISFVVFLVEVLSKIKEHKKLNKLKYAKVHPSEDVIEVGSGRYTID